MLRPPDGVPRNPNFTGGVPMNVRHLALMTTLVLSISTPAVWANGLFGEGLKIKVPITPPHLPVISPPHLPPIIRPLRPPMQSGLTVTSPPFIASDGWVYSGTGRTNTPTSRVFHLGRPQYDAEGRAWWHSNYSDVYGRVDSPVRAPANYERGEQVRLQRERERLRREAGGNLTNDNVVIPPTQALAASTPAIRLVINPRTGQIIEEAFLGGIPQGARIVGQAQLLRDDLGGFMVWAPPSGYPVAPVRAQ